MRTFGLVVLILGALLTIFTAFTFFTKEKVVDIGKVQVSADKRHHLTWSPLIGIGVMAVGGVIMVSAKRQTA